MKRVFSRWGKIESLIYGSEGWRRIYFLCQGFVVVSSNKGIRDADADVNIDADADVNINADADAVDDVDIETDMKF